MQQDPRLQGLVPGQQTPFAVNIPAGGPSREQRTQELMQLIQSAATDEEADQILSALNPEELADIETAAGITSATAPSRIEPPAPVATIPVPASPYADDFSQMSEEELSAELQRIEEEEELAKRGTRGVLDNSFGLGVRGVVQGAMAPFGMAADWLVSGPVNAVAGEELFPPSNEVVSALLDKAGLPKPATKGERMLNSVVEFASGVPVGGLVGKAMTSGRMAANPSLAQVVAERAGQGLQASPGMQTLGAVGGGLGSQYAIERGDNPVIGAVAGSLAPSAVGAGLGATVRGIVRGGASGREAVAEAISDYAQAGTTPTVGQASPKEWVQGLEANLSRFTPSSRVIREKLHQQGDQIGHTVRQRADYQTQAGDPIRPTQAGEKVLDDFENVFQPSAQAEISRSYRAYDKLLPPTTIASPKNIVAFIRGKVKPVQGAENFTTNEHLLEGVEGWKSVLRDISADVKKHGGISVQGFKTVRSQIGDQLSEGVLKETKLPQKDLRAAYRALSEDMREAAKEMDRQFIAQGKSPNALKQFERANSKAEAYFDHLEKVQKVLDKSGGGEKIFETALSGTANGATTLEAVYKTLTPEGRKILSAAIIRQATKPTATEQNAAKNAFSIGTFARQYGNWSPEMKEAVLKPFGKEYRENFETVMRVVDDIAKGVPEVGYARTASEGRGGFQAMLYPILAMSGGAAGLGVASGGNPMVYGATAAAGTAGLFAAAHSLSKLMVNQKAVKFLAESTTLSPAAFASALNAEIQASRKAGEVEYAEGLEALQQGAN